MSSYKPGSYFVPESSHWPIVGSIGLFVIMVGFINWVHSHPVGPWLFLAGAAIMIYMMYGWFGDVIKESLSGKHSAQMDRSYRLSMMWFIFSEVMFFGAFFGALFYARVISVSWLGGDTSNSAHILTHYLLWPDFKNGWPLLHNPDPSQFLGPKEAMHAWGLAAINTMILLTSGLTITIAHWGIKENHRKKIAVWLGLTILLGITFLCCQAYEYHEAYVKMGLTLASGIYGTTFFMLTGFHGAHVTIGTIMLFVVWLRVLKGHFTPEHHFAFEAAAWYWHFVDVVWLLLFIFVYWL